MARNDNLDITKIAGALFLAILIQLWIIVGWTFIRSAICETGILSNRCSRTAAAFSTAVKVRRFCVIMKSPQVRIAHDLAISNFKRGSTLAGGPSWQGARAGRGPELAGGPIDD